MYAFIKLTSNNGSPIYINGNLVTAVHEHSGYKENTPTIVEVIGDDNSFFWVKESVETVTDLLYGAMHE